MSIPSMANHTSCVYDGKMYVFGGSLREKNGFSSSLRVYNHFLVLDLSKVFFNCRSNSLSCRNWDLDQMRSEISSSSTFKGYRVQFR